MKSVSEMRIYLNATADFEGHEFDVLAHDPNWKEALENEGIIKSE